MSEDANKQFESADIARDTVQDTGRDTGQTATMTAPEPEFDLREEALPIVRSPLAGQLQTTPLSQRDKAAIVLMALGPEASAQLLEQLDEEEIRSFARASSALGEVQSAQVDTVLDEFQEILLDEMHLSGGSDLTRDFLAQVTDENTINRIMEDVAGSPGSRSVWSDLSDAAEDDLALWLKSEHPQLASVVLSRLRSDKAARILEKFDEHLAMDVIMRMSRPPTYSKDTLEQITKVISDDIYPRMSKSKAARKPADLIAGLMNHVSRDNRDHYIAQLDRETPEFSKQVQKIMFTFSDIALRVSPRDIGLVMRAIDEETLVVALKAGLMVDDPTVEFVLGNITRRLSERLAEDIDAAPEPSSKEADRAQMELVGAIQLAADRGDIRLIEQEDELW